MLKDAWHLWREARRRLSLSLREEAALAAVVLLVLGAGVWTWHGRQPQPIVIVKGNLPAYRINVNQASKEELEILPGIGEISALKIVTYREAHGQFRTMDDLTLVPGVSAKVVAQIAEWVVFDSPKPPTVSSPLIRSMTD